MRRAAQLSVGDAAPKFRAIAVGGEYGAGREVSLADFRGMPVVLYFYPKDDTPGCTAQACGLRDAWSDFADKAKIFGVSIDSTVQPREIHREISAAFSALVRSHEGNR